MEQLTEQTTPQAVEMSEHKVDVVSHTIENLVAETVRLTLDGFVVDPAMPGEAIGVYSNVYTVSFVRNQDTIEKVRCAVSNIAEKPKMSRAETLAVAREAKKARQNNNLASLDVSTVKSD